MAGDVGTIESTASTFASKQMDLPVNTYAIDKIVRHFDKLKQQLAIAGLPCRRANDENNLESK